MPPTPTDVRLKLLRAGFDPIPVNGKRPLFAGWQKMIGVAEHEIERWARACPADENTGVLTARTPTFDIDILDPDAAQAVEDLVRELLEERGEILTRCGRWPKRAIPFRTDTPFAKIQVLFAGARAEKLEFLCDGQQFVVAGIHEITHKPYVWTGGEPGDVARDALPYIHGSEALELFDQATQLLIDQFGYQILGKSKPKAAKDNVADRHFKGNGAGYAGSDWSEYWEDATSGDHNRMTSCAMAYLNGGMRPASVENMLFDGLKKADIDEERRKRREREIPAMVASAWRKIQAELAESEDARNLEDGREQPSAPAASALAELDEWDIADAEKPPPRGWLLGHSFCRTFVSEVVAPGGGGKTALRYLQYLALSSGRPLTGERIWRRARVLIISLEDDAAEANRRLYAAMLHHGVAEDEIRGWLFVSAPGARLGKLISLDRSGRVATGPLTLAVERAIKRRKPDLISFDPFVKAHGVEENNNNQVDQVIQILTDLATKHDIAIDLVHHSRKGAPDPGNADQARGASANANAARLVYTLTVMSAEEAKRFGIPDEERRLYFRLDIGKVNTASPARKTMWFKLVGVRIDNPSEAYPDGDEVQTVEPWIPPAAFADLDTGACNRILDDIDKGMADNGRYSASPAATVRAAWPVVQKHAPEKTAGQAREVIAQWVKNGLLVEEDIYDKTRHPAKGLRVDNAKRPGTRS